MAKMRSPNYPSISLADAIELARAIWTREKRTAVSGEVIAHAWDYKSLSGPVRTKIGALRKYGLLESHGDGLRLSDLAMRLIHSQRGNDEYLQAVKEAALKPELFRDLHATHADASDQALQSHLIVKKGFSDAGAKLAAAAYKATLALAKPGDGGYNSNREESEDNGSAAVSVGDTVQWESGGVLQFPEPKRVRALSDDGEWAFVDGSETGLPVKELIVENPAPNTPPVGTAKQPPKMPLPEPPAPTQVFSWPLSKGVTAEVKLTGSGVTSNHLELLRDYLELAKKAIQGGEA